MIMFVEYANLSRVDFPAPRKPDIMVSGTRGTASIPETSDSMSVLKIR